MLCNVRHLLRVNHLHAVADRSDEKLADQRSVFFIVKTTAEQGLQDDVSAAGAAVQIQRGAQLTGIGIVAYRAIKKQYSPPCVHR